MKRIRIIAVLVLLAIVGIELGEIIRGTRDGWNEITVGDYATSLSLYANSPIATDSVQSTANGTFLPYQLNSVSGIGLRTQPADTSPLQRFACK